MIQIHVNPIGVVVTLEPGETLHDGLERHGIVIETPCGGMGDCGACRILASPPESTPPTRHEDISQEDEAKGVRLACRAVPVHDCSVTLCGNYIYDKSDNIQGEILVDFVAPPVLQPDGCAIPEVINPAVTVCRSNGAYQCRYDRLSGAADLSDWKPEFHAKGLSIDIGTTTMVLSLVSLETGEVLARRTSMNPQVVHGHDVMTRITYAKTEKGLFTLASLVRDKINELIADVCRDTGSSAEEILDAAIGANTTMLQLAAAMDVTPLSKVPFRFDIKGGVTHPASLFGLQANKAARVYLPPVIHAFVGSDISAGLLLCPDFFDATKSILFIDLGTNGEMCLNVRGTWFATSTAAGPAFEGMGLSTGMRARSGAVERVAWNGDTFLFHTIGNSEIKGVCGSGIVDFLAALLESGYLEPSGRYRNPNGNAWMKRLGDQLVFEYGKGIYLTQKDVRQIQLAKGAVRAGIDMILESGGITCNDLDRIFIAGGFGHHLKPAMMERIGLIPENTSGKVQFLGNTSAAGSTALLTQKNNRVFIEEALDSIRYVSLAESKDFMDCFIKSLNFPAAPLNAALGGAPAS